MMEDKCRPSVPMTVAAKYALVCILQCIVAMNAQAQTGTTQIVVQWRYVGSAGLTMLSRIYSREHVIESRCGNLCFVDGHDIGSGTANIFLYADDENVDATVNAVVGLLDEKRLPDGMQIGVAEYRNSERTDWEYRPAFPPSLESFGITYPGDERGL